jgi:predicted nucleic acid-binding protein
VTIAQSRGWLIDTNVVSELRKAARCAPAVRAWAESVPPVACYLSRVSVAEIRFGILQVTDVGFRAELDAWVRDGLLPWFADRILEVDDYTYSQPDALLAATALVHELGVVTRNAEDFTRAGVRLLNPWQ